MSEKRIAVVTGGNRGIGFEIARQLGKAGYCVVLTARDPQKGEAAADKLRGEQLDVTFHLLDVADERSIGAFAAWLKDAHGRCDVLVNNAGILPDPRGTRLADTAPATVRAAFETNALAPLLLIQAVLPLMRKRKHGRIVNVSSGLGQLSDMSTGSIGYRLSKTALNAVTRIAAAEARGTDILVNSACPGWVKTDMGGPGASRTVEQGADTAVWLATLPAGGPTGGFFRDRKPIPW
jgi:NAD(P)-dependent dehydrogenase (short-subunit alcohol dehydrogenase family)